MIILALLAVQAAGAAATASTPDPDQDDAIVVTATRLKDAKIAWEACLEHGCSPEKEMKAAIRFANALFLNGDFATARQTLANAQRRNGRYAKTYPLLVSDLARANARVSSFDGQPAAAMDQTLEAVSALKRGLDSQDAIVMMQRLETGDQMWREGRLETASSIYHKVARQAEKLGLTAVRGHALFRDAVLISAVATVDPVYATRAKAAVARIADDKDPAMAPFKDGLTQLSARLSATGLAHPKVDAIAKVSPVSSPAAIGLIYEPFFDFERSGLTNPTTLGDAAEWADVAFWIRPDGTVSDVEVRQTSRNKPGTWLPAKLKVVEGRRYTPFPAAPDAPGIYRVERYAMIQDMMMPTASHTYVRSPAPQPNIQSPIPRMETIDLSSTYRGSTIAVK